MATRLPRNFAVDPVNGAYGDEEDRLAQAIGDAVNGPGGPSSGTSAATIASGVDQSANTTAIRAASENTSSKINSVDTNAQAIADATGTQGDATTANTITGILKAVRNSFTNLLNSVGLTLGDDLATIKDNTDQVEQGLTNIGSGIGDSTDAALTDPTTDGGLTGIIKGFWRDNLAKLDEVIANSNAQVAITPVSHDISVTPGTPVTLLTQTGGEVFNIIRIEVAFDTPAAVEFFLGATSVAKFFNAELITLPFEEFGFLSNTGTDDLTVNVTETVGTVRLTGTTWYEATGVII